MSSMTLRQIETVVGSQDGKHIVAICSDGGVLHYTTPFTRPSTAVVSSVPSGAVADSAIAVPNAKVEGGDSSTDALVDSCIGNTSIMDTSICIDEDEEEDKSVADDALTGVCLCVCVKCLGHMRYFDDIHVCRGGATVGVSIYRSRQPDADK